MTLIEVTPKTKRAHGVDLSKYDVWFRPELATHQLDFAIQRLSYGMAQDELLAPHMQAMQAMPVRGAYHYLSSHVPWKAQMDFFMELMSRSPRRYLFCAVDFEKYYNDMTLRFAEDFGKSMAYLESKLDIPVLLYTNRSTYNTWLSGRTWAKKHHLWLAQYWYYYSADKNPSLPNNRTNWTFWQYTDKENGTKWGLPRPHACDVDVFDGTVTELISWLKGEPEVVELPNPPIIPTPTLEQRVEALEKKVFGAG